MVYRLGGLFQLPLPLWWCLWEQFPYLLFIELFCPTRDLIIISLHSPSLAPQTLLKGRIGAGDTPDIDFFLPFLLPALYSC